jgi:hypothetical protein
VGVNEGNGMEKTQQRTVTIAASVIVLAVRPNRNWIIEVKKKTSTPNNGRISLVNINFTNSEYNKIEPSIQYRSAQVAPGGT